MNELESASLARLTARPEPAEIYSGKPAEILSNTKVEKNSAESKDSGGDDSIWNKVSREAYVVGGGLWSGIADNAREAVRNPAKALPELGIAAGTGALLSLAHGRKGLIGLGAKVLGLGFAAGFVKDLTSEERLSGIGNAVSDTWKSSEHLEQNRDAIKHHAGQFAFDTALMIAGGSLGAGAVRYGRPSQLPFYRERTQSLAGSMSLQRDGFAVDRHLPAVEVLPSEPMVSSRFAQVIKQKPAGSFDAIKAGEKLEFPSPNGQPMQWKQTNESIRVRLEAQQFVGKMTSGDYLGALNVAVESPSLNGVVLNPATKKHSITMKASEFKHSNDVALGMDRMGDLGKFQWHQARTSSELLAQDLTAIVPKVNVELKPGTVVPLVDFVPSNNGYKAQFSSTTTFGAKLSEAEAAQMLSLRQSPAGQRLIAETAIIAFEEATVHANQHSNGGIMSPTFALFSKELTLNTSYGTRSHMLAFLGTLSSRDPNRVYVFEQEVPALLYDAGMPLSMIKHHYFFGSRHVPERRPIMDFLDKREAL
jgi:hypothetical protein